MKEFWDPRHPVLELMHSRRATGDAAGNRTDGAKLGLAVEGGGMRGIISCAMLSALEDQGYGAVFDAIYGGSSGSVNAAYFLSGQVWHSLSIYYDDLASTRFIDLRRALSRQAIFDVDYAFDVVFDLTKPLNYGAVLASNIPLYVSITLVDEARTITPSTFTSKADLKEALRAGSWLPVATRGTASFRGQRAIDGGALTAHPSRVARADGCTHVLSLSTRPASYRRIRPDLLQRYAGWRLDRLRPGLGVKFLEADRICAEDRLALARWRTRPQEQPAVLDLCPPSDAGLARHHVDPGRLHEAARTGYEIMCWALTDRYERAYPRLTTMSRERAIHRLG